MSNFYKFYLSHTYSKTLEVSWPNLPYYLINFFLNAVWLNLFFSLNLRAFIASEIAKAQQTPSVPWFETLRSLFLTAIYSTLYGESPPSDYELFTCNLYDLCEEVLLWKNEPPIFNSKDYKFIKVWCYKIIIIYVCHIKIYAILFVILVIDFLVFYFYFFSFNWRLSNYFNTNISIFQTKKHPNLNSRSARIKKTVILINQIQSILESQLNFPNQLFKLGNGFFTLCNSIRFLSHREICSNNLHAQKIYPRCQYADHLLNRFLGRSTNTNHNDWFSC
jgi:hypothetical protein